MDENSRALQQVTEDLSSVRFELDQLKAQMGRITGITTAIIYILDSDGNFTYINNAVLEILHFDPSEIIGRHFSSIMSLEEYKRISRELVIPQLSGKHPDSAPPKLFNERRSGDRRTRNLEVQLLTKENEPRILLGDVSGIIQMSNGGGASPEEIFIGSQGVLFDITRYKQSELERMELQRKLFAIQKMDALGKLSSKVAHDLNNKLGSIIGCAEVIKGDFEVDPKVMRFVDTILSASRNAFELANRLSEFSRSDSGEIEIIEIHSLINSILELVNSGRSENVSVVQVYNAKSSIVLGNYYYLQNAILNLIINAFEAMAQGGKLCIESHNRVITADYLKSINSAANPGFFIGVSIIDTGTGMSPEIMNHLFEPFFTTKPGSGAIGLGMASANETVKNHGGFLLATSKHGRGTRVDLYLPVAENSAT